MRIRLSSPVAVGKIAGLLHCKKLTYRIARKFIPYERKDVELVPLDSFHKDGGRSCVISHRIPDTFDYDLQIIVPVYNTGKYLAQCLDSVLGSETSYKYIIYCINDGSTDNSGAILEEYAGDERVVIINQANGGISAARNAGLDNIVAPYLMFIDSDDTIDRHAIDSLLRAAFDSNADIVQGEFLYCLKNGIKKRAHVRNSDFLPGFAHGKVLKSRLFERVGFPEGYWFEDFLTNLILVPLAERIKIIDDIVYYYRQNDKGIFFQSKTNVKVIDSFWVLKKLVEDMEILGIEKNMEYYHVVLDKIKTCARLSMELGNISVDMSLFYACRQLITNQFREYVGQGKYLPEMEAALVSGNYPLFRISCIFEQ